MKRFVLLAGTIVMAAWAPAQARPHHHAAKATGPVPQSAEIAALNRKSLAKASSPTGQKPAASTATKP